MPDDSLATFTLDEVVASLVDAHAAKFVTLDPGDRYVEQQGEHFMLRYPLSGDIDTFLHITRLGGQWSGSSGFVELRITPDLNQLSDSETDWDQNLEAALEEVDTAMLEGVRKSNLAIAKRRDEMGSALRAALAPRSRLTRLMRGSLHRLHVPLGPRDSDRVHVPLTPSPLSVRSLAAGASQQRTEDWILADSMAEMIIETITAFSRALERLPATANSMLDHDEEAMRDTLLFVLNANFQGQVTGETFIGRGKADVLLRWKDRDAFVAECKIWKGRAAFENGVEQLLSRYALWRHTRLALILFIREPNDGTRIIQTATDALAHHSRTQHVRDVRNATERSDFEVLAGDDDHRLARLVLIPVVVSAP
ncbi:hypothetical protein ACO03V_02635 [Microbacterium sp. HMH0099]|uniref:hypothetical protein n=1 Tax=Microbacterium sp. HMH0099 TaxID=3414026 RepID=UPI003BF7562F